MSDDPAAGLNARIQAFEARVADWPTWKKLAVFGPALLLVLALLVTALDFVGIGVFGTHGHH